MSSPCVGLCHCMYVYVVKCDVFSLVCRATRAIYAEGRARIAPIALSPAFRVLDARDLRRGLRGYRSSRTLACISRTRHAQSPQRVARAHINSHSRLHFAHSTRTISAEGCARTGQIALSPAFRALDARARNSRLRFVPSTRAISAEGCAHTGRIALSPAFAHSTRTVSAEGCARTGQIALSPAFRALDARDLRRRLRGHGTNRTLACISRARRTLFSQRVARTPDKSHPTLACISRTRHARSRQRVARAWDKSHSRVHFAHSTRTISAEGCAHTGHIALSPACRALDTHDLRRGLHFRLTLFAPPSAFKREFIKWGNVFHYFSLGHLPRKFFHTRILITLASFHLDTCRWMLLASFHLDTCRWMLSLFHLHWGTYRSVSVHVHVQV